MEKSQATKKEINVILDKVQIQNLIKQHQSNFQKYSERHKEISLKNICDINKETGVSLIRLEIGKKKYSVLSHNDQLYIKVPQDHFKDLKDGKYNMSISTHYTNEHGVEASFADKHEYNLMIQKQEQQKSTSKQPNKLALNMLENNKNRMAINKIQDDYRKIEEEKKKLIARYNDMGDLYCNKKVEELKKILNLNKNFIAETVKNMIEAGKLDENTLFDLAYRCNRHDILSQIEKLDEQLKQQNIQKERNEDFLGNKTISTEPSRHPIIHSKNNIIQPINKKKQKLNINMNNIDNTNSNTNKKIGQKNGQTTTVVNTNKINIPNNDLTNFSFRQLDQSSYHQPRGLNNQPNTEIDFNA